MVWCPNNAVDQQAERGDAREPGPIPLSVIPAVVFVSGLDFGSAARKASLTALDEVIRGPGLTDEMCLLAEVLRASQFFCDRDHPSP